MTTFELSLIGGPWGHRLAPRRAWIDELPWDERVPQDLDGARVTWTGTAFAEYASAAAFAEIAAALLACGAPIDLVAAAGDFVVDEIVHTEVAARLAAALGGAVALEVDLEKLVRPARSADPLVRCAELIVRTSCVGEAMTVPILKLARDHAGSALFEAAIAKIVADESHHAQIGSWFLDWADDRLDDEARDHLGRVAGAALRDLAPTPSEGCVTGYGRLACAIYDPAFVRAADERVVQPLARYGIRVPDEDRAVLRGVAHTDVRTEDPTSVAV